jgi:hypothetical protein
MKTPFRHFENWTGNRHDRGAVGDLVIETPDARDQKDKRVDYQRIWKGLLQKPEWTSAKHLAPSIKGCGFDCTHAG